MFSVYFIFPVFTTYQLFLLEINILYNLILNMVMFTYQVIKISSKIIPLSYPFFVDICLFADIVFTGDTFHSNLRKNDRFFHQYQVNYNATKKGQRDLYKNFWIITHQSVFVSPNYFTHDHLRQCSIILVANIIIRLNAINYFTNTFIIAHLYTLKKEQYYF